MLSREGTVAGDEKSGIKQRMKIMLLYPRWTVKYGIAGHFARRASTWPPLNLAYLAAVAEAAGHTVRIIDGQIENMPVDEMVRRAVLFSPDIIGVTATTPFFHIVEHLARELKRSLGSVPIALGGTHLTVLKNRATTTSRPCSSQ